MEDGLLVTLRLTIFFLATRSVSCCCRFRVHLEEGGGGTEAAAVCCLFVVEKRCILECLPVLVWR
jgi:hypothetical protein